MGYGVPPEPSCLLLPSVATSRELLDAALASHRAGDLVSAGDFYRRVLELEPGQPDALNLLAAVEMEAGDYPSAARHLRRAIASAEGVAQYHCNLGNALLGAGDLAGAAESYRRAIALEPDFADARSSLGFVLARSGETSEALASLRAALAIEPGHFYALNNLGDLLGASGDLAGAEDAYRRASAVAPGASQVLAKLGAVMRRQGRPEEALEYLWAALEAEHAAPGALIAIGSLLRNMLPAAYDPVLERRLLDLFARPGIDFVDLVDFATALVKLKYSSAAGFRSIGDPVFVVEELLGDPLVQVLCTRTVLGDPHLEILLTGARRWLTVRGEEGGPSRLVALAALAQQCFNNEYVYAIGEDERARVQVAREVLEGATVHGTTPGAAIERALLCFAMYAPPVSLACAARLAAFPLSAWDPALRPLVARALHEPMEEAALASEIPVVGRVRDAVSEKVKAQYEESPYPRWLTPAYRPPGNLHGILAGMFPGFEPPEILRHPVRVLVVGCGTGHHPISIAMRYANAEVVATDISRSSLAYGVRMARALRVDNVRFVENDLLNLELLDGVFHVIECVGVLHHTRSMEKGLMALLGKLHADGLLKLGLYSRSAREPVALARRRIAELGLGPGADDIRRFREAVLAAAADDPLRRILDFGDFYTLSNCRDLLFHAHEQDVTIADVGGLLDAAALRFIGFELVDDTLAERYRRRFPEDPDQQSLSRWQELEALLPSAFAGMYQLWCARRRAD